MNIQQKNNPKQLRQPQRQYKRTLPKQILHDYRIIRAHMIDGIYQGFVNSSYQKDGFGILQSNNFQMYLGFFKCNKIHGTGLIIFPDGSKIYGKFENGSLNGVALSDNGFQLQVGIFKDINVVGIGFQFDIKKKKWKMNRYHKGVAIQVLRQQQVTQQNPWPTILNIEPQFLQLYFQYRNHQYFGKSKDKRAQIITQNIIQDLDSFFYHQITDKILFYGAIIEGKYQGLGALIDKSINKMIQCGDYKNGQLQGYGFKRLADVTNEQQGLYIKGKRNGPFLINQLGKKKFCLFKDNLLINDQLRDTNQVQIQKAKKLFNYREKDFLSIKANINFQSLKQLFQSTQFKAWKLQQKLDKTKKQEILINKPLQVKKIKNTPSSSSNMNITFEKSSIQIMKQKINNLLLNKKQQKKPSKSGKNLNHKMIQSKDQSKNIQVYQESDDASIAQQQNPIFGERQEKMKIQKTKKYNMYHS